jgi:hypothetical protein
MERQTMIAGFICTLVGAVQFYLLKRLTGCALRSERGAVWFILAKIVLYALAAALVLALLPGQVIGAGIGLAAGMLGSAILSSIYTLVSGKGA